MHHKLDPSPIPKDETPLYVNETWLVDKSLLEYETILNTEPDAAEDNVRVYIPMDINRDAILRRLDVVIAHYGEANEENGLEFSIDVGMIISQIEVYDQVWYVRHMPEGGKHSTEAVSLVKEVVTRLEEIPDGCAECFPFEEIEELRREYIGDRNSMM